MIRYPGQMATHFLWKAFMAQKDPGFVVGGKHDGHPLCRVPGRRKWVCASDPKEVTCRACLKRMALEVHGEESWRKRIIGCYVKSGMAVAPGRTELVKRSLTEQGFTDGGAI